MLAKKLERVDKTAVVQINDGEMTLFPHLNIFKQQAFFLQRAMWSLFICIHASYNQ